MIVVNLKGGLGNQMFQYALGMALEHKYGTELKVDLRFLENRSPRKDFIYRTYDLDIFSIHPTRATANDLGGVGLGIENFRARQLWVRILANLPVKSRLYRERRFSFDNEVMTAGKNLYVDGYWQSEKYFENIATLVRERFIVNVPLSVEASQLLYRIEEEESVCLNVRRSDFVNHPVLRSLETEYFVRAVERLSRHIGKSFRLFIFSDDVEWCRENLRLWPRQEVVDHRYAGPKFSNYFTLMSACKHFVIPNSSFAWWAAWLAKHKNKTVIGPKRWFGDPTIDTSDVLPTSWISE